MTQAVRERTREAELNEAILRYLVRCIEEDTPSRMAEQLGIDGTLAEQLAREIPQLRLCELQRFAGTRAMIGSIRLNPQALSTLLTVIRSDRHKEQSMIALLKAQAPHEMLYSLFGLDRNTYSTLRRRHGVSNTGRPRTPTAEQEQKLLDALDHHGLDSDELRTRRDSGIWLQLCEETGMTLGTLWALVQQWRMDE